MESIPMIHALQMQMGAVSVAMGTGMAPRETTNQIQRTLDRAMGNAGARQTSWDDLRNGATGLFDVRELPRNDL